MRTLSLVLVTAVVGSAAGASPTAERFGLPAVADSLKSADKVVVYRGVPRKGEPRPWPVTGKPFEFGGAQFGSDPQPIPTGEAKQLADWFAGPSFKKFPDGVSRCLGYHPWYMLEWTAKDQTYRVQFCFFCNEVKVFKYPVGKESAAALEAHYPVDAGDKENAREGFRRLMAAHFARK